MPGILASGRRLEELIDWKLKGNSSAKILNLCSERLGNFESYEIEAEERALGLEKAQALEEKKTATYNINYPKANAPLTQYPTILYVDLSHNFLKNFDSLLYVLPNAWWINISFNGIQVLPTNTHLPTVIGSLDLGHNDTLDLGSFSDLHGKHILRLTLTLGVKRARDKNGVLNEVHSSTYKARRDSLLLSCPNLWTVNDVFTTNEEVTTLQASKAELTDSDKGISKNSKIAITSNRNNKDSKRDYSLFVDLSAKDWSSRVLSKREAAILSAEQSLSPQRRNDMDAFHLAILLDDYLEEACIANENGSAYHGIKGRKYPKIHVGRILELDRQTKLNFAALLTAWIRSYIPEKLYKEGLQTILGKSFAQGEINDIICLPEFACTSLVCFLRRLVLREIDDLNGDSDDFSSIFGSRESSNFVREITAEAQYDYDFLHIHELMKTLRKTNQGSPGGKSKSSPSKRREKKQVGVTREEVMQITVLPDIVTSNFPDVLENDKTQIYEELHWTSLLSRCVMEILHTTPSFRKYNFNTYENSVNEYTSSDHKSIRESKSDNRNSQILRGTTAECNGDLENHIDDLNSLTLSEEISNEVDGLTNVNKVDILDNSVTPSKRLVVSIASSLEEQPGENLDGGLDAQASLELSINSSIDSSPKASVFLGDLADHTDDNLFSNLDRKKIDSVTQGKGKSDRERVPKYTPSVTVYTTNRVASPTFAMAPLKDIVKERVNSSEDTAFLVEVPVYVQAHQLPKLETDCVSVDKLLPIVEKGLENPSIASMSTIESTMSMATAARTMLAEMGTLRNVRSMQKQNTAATQKKIDNTTWKPSYELQRRAGTAPSGVARDIPQPSGEGVSWFAGLAQSNAYDTVDKPASIGAYLEAAWKEQVEAENRDHEEEVERNKRFNTPANLKPRLVTGVTKKLLTAVTPIEKLKMSTQYTNINMHTVDSRKSPGEVIFAEKTPDGRPLSATWYPVKEKKEYVVSNAANQNPLEAMTQSTAHWSERVIRGSPTSRGGGFSIRPTEATMRARTAGSISRRSAASKVIHGHNEGFWPLDTSHTGSRLQQSLQDTRDIVLTSRELDFGQSEMSRKITRDKMNNPSSRGPLAAATKNLSLNAGFKVKYANGSKYPPAVKPLPTNRSRRTDDPELSTQGFKKRLARQS